MKIQCNVWQYELLPEFSPRVRRYVLDSCRFNCLEIIKVAGEEFYFYSRHRMSLIVCILTRVFPRVSIHVI
jgi:hypothetical protein